MNHSKETKAKLSRIMIGKFKNLHPAWKGQQKKINKYGYIELINWPGVQKKCIREHRFIIELFLNRKLKDEETPHHINGIKTDNKIENLYLFSTRGTHRSFENKLRKNPELKHTLKSNLKELKNIEFLNMTGTE